MVLQLESFSSQLCQPQKYVLNIASYVPPLHLDPERKKQQVVPTYKCVFFGLVSRHLLSYKRFAEVIFLGSLPLCGMALLQLWVGTVRAIKIHVIAALGKGNEETNLLKVKWLFSML